MGPNKTPEALPLFGSLPFSSAMTPKPILLTRFPTLPLMVST